MAEVQVPIWQRYVLTVTEAAEYYHIGEPSSGKLRKITPKLISQF